MITNEFFVNDDKVKSGFQIVKGYDNLYLVNPFGQIVAPSYVDKTGAFRKSKVLKVSVTKKGYLRIRLMLNGEQVHRSVHRIVAQTFIPNPLNKPEVNHIDGNKKNNNIGNLEWVTTQENIIHSYQTNIRKGTDARGERNNMSKLTKTDVLDIRASELSAMELAEKFGVSKSAIYKIKKGVRWNFE